MSEHLSVNGKVNYWHLPYDEEGAFTFCRHCQSTCDRVTVEFHQGWVDDWMNLNCAKCGKSIWTSKLHRKPTNDNKKCWICGKPTNWVDCSCISSRIGESIERYTCSNKCSSKEDIFSCKVNFFLDELDLCIKEQGFDIKDDCVFKFKLKIAREIATSSVVKKNIR